MYRCPNNVVLCFLENLNLTLTRCALICLIPYMENLNRLSQVLRNIDLQRTAERSFPSWKGPSGVGCKPNFVTPVEPINKLDTAGAEETLTFVTSVREKMV